MIVDGLLLIIVLLLVFQSYQLWGIIAALRNYQPSTVYMTATDYQEAIGEESIDLIPTYDQMFDVPEAEDGDDA